MDNLAKEYHGESLNASGSSPKQMEQCGEEFDIIEYKSQYREEFKRLNMEWIKQFFWIEPIDNEVLSDPEKYFLQRGGYIWFARLRYCEGIVGTCALLRHDEQGFELAKMGVTRCYRGMGIGRKLAETALAQIKSLGEKQVFLETNSKLMAMHLYKKLGFSERPFPNGRSERYQRANVYMVLEF